MNDWKTLSFEVRDRVGVITLNRPDVANGLNFKMACELADVAKHCDNDDAIRSVVLAANGQFFSAGGDIKEMASHGEHVGAKVKELADRLHMAISTFARMQAPVVCAVNGMAAGAGFSLAVSGDIVIANSDAVFVMAYTRAGLSPDGGSTYYLPRIIGLRRTQELMLTNRQLSAGEALDWGLISEVVDNDTLLERSVSIANSLAEGPAEANATVKRLLLNAFNNSLETQMEFEGRAISQCAQSADGREGIAAFISKRRPTFE